MCGRFVRKTSPQDLAKLFHAKRIHFAQPPSFNVAPTHPVAVIMEDGVRKLVEMRWGLIPSWAKDMKIGAKTINARAESILTRPAFRTPFLKRRCIIPADGFYEWRTEGKQKKPVFIYRRDNIPCALAGIYDTWTDPKSGEIILSCSIITTNAHEKMRHLHHRMPAMIPTKHQDQWLDPQTDDISFLQSLLQPYDPVDMKWDVISDKVNKVDYNQPDCIEPLA